jgi:ethanolamine ammonia-lyase small subunit
MNIEHPTSNAQHPTPDTSTSTFDVGRSAFDVRAAGGDTWQHLRQHTAARIALGRTGGSQRTESILDFRLSHARARDAVHSPFGADALEQAMRNRGLFTYRLSTAAENRRTYLIRPDLGRTLDDPSRKLLFANSATWGRRDLAIIVSDGLAAQAAEQHAIDLLLPLVGHLLADGWTLYPIFVVPYARVKLQDEIGELLGARHTLMLLGERPGLGSPDSLGAYFTFNPRAACTDADRNCISNIRPEGIPPVNAADKLARLLAESARLGLSGVALKDTNSLPLPKLTLP